MVPVNVAILVKEAQAQGRERRLQRRLAFDVIRVGYKALSSRIYSMHPERGRLDRAHALLRRFMKRGF
jgi:hypothetical protein